MKKYIKFIVILLILVVLVLVCPYGIKNGKNNIGLIKTDKKHSYTDCFNFEIKAVAWHYVKKVRAYENIEEYDEIKYKQKKCLKIFDKTVYSHSQYVGLLHNIDKDYNDDPSLIPWEEFLDKYQPEKMEKNYFAIGITYYVYERSGDNVENYVYCGPEVSIRRMELFDSKGDMIGAYHRNIDGNFYCCFDPKKSADQINYIEIALSDKTYKLLMVFEEDEWLEDLVRQINNYRIGETYMTDSLDTRIRTSVMILYNMEEKGIELESIKADPSGRISFSKDGISYIFDA